MRSLLVVTLLCAVALGDARRGSLADARQALQALDFAGAAREARAAIAAGGHAADELSELYAVEGEAASVAESADAGERAFRAELALAPDHAPPSRSSPVVMRPFARARDFILAHGALRASQHVATAADGYRISSAAESDPLGMVARRQLWWRDDGGRYSPAILDGADFRVPLRPGLVEYYVQFLDAAGNELLSLGDSAHPLRLIAATSPEPAARPRHPLRIAGITLAVAGVGLLATGVAMNVVYAGDYGKLERSCGSACKPPQLSGLDVDRGISIAGYASGGVLVATSLVLLVIDGWQSRRRGDGATSASPSRP